MLEVRSVARFREMSVMKRSGTELRCDVVSSRTRDADEQRSDGLELRARSGEQRAFDVRAGYVA